MNKLFLLDAYALIFRAYYALMRAPRVNSKGVNTSAVFGFLNTLNDVLIHQEPSHIAVVFDPSTPTFRHEIYPEYKAQREETPEVIRQSVPMIKQLLAAYRIPVIQVDGYEADDVIGTLAFQAAKQGFDTYMMTPDKDYCQLVGPHRFIFKPKKQGNDCEVWGVEQVKERYGIERPDQVIDLLGLMGDASDNIPGCPKVGEKRAVELIKQFDNIENLLQNTAQLKGSMRQTVEDNVEQIRLSRFLATIKIDVPYSLNAEALRRQEPDNDALRSLFREWEFHTQLRKLEPQPQTTSNSQNDSMIGGLFGQIETTQEETIATPAENLNINFRLINSKEELADALANVKALSFFSLLTTLEGMKAEPIAIGIATGKNEGIVVRFPSDRVSINEWLNVMKPVMENEEVTKTGYNLKPFIVMMLHHGIKMHGPLFDIEVAHYILNAELPHYLEVLAQQYINATLTDLPVVKGNYEALRDTLSTEMLIQLVGQRAAAVNSLQPVLDEEIKKYNLTELCYKIEMPLIGVLASMEFRGVMIDDFALANLSQEFTVKLSTIEQQIRKYAEGPINVNSPKQIGELLFGQLKIVDKPRKTKSGQYVTDEETLVALKEVHPVVELILEYRGMKKLLSTYIDALPAIVNNETGKIHTSFNQTVTATGRLSSSNPNLQNIPIRDDNGKSIRKAFIPNEGESFLSADYSQIELRLMAHLSNDTNLLEAFRADHDIHAATAALIYKVPITEVTSDMRRRAKTANFGIIYGISAFGLAERLNIPRSEAQELIDHYFASFPGVRDYINNQQLKAQKQGYVETLYHRQRQLPDINSHNANVRAFANRNAVNAPIQGTAADIMKLAMVRIHQRIEKEGLKAQMLIQVHDELDFSVPQNEIETLKHIVTEEMEHVVKLSVPLKAEVGIGTNWLEAH